MSDSDPVGQRFSQVYLERGSPTRDSARFRMRLFSVLRSIGLCSSEEFLRFYQSRTGSVGPAASYENYWQDYITNKAEIRDLLDLTTLVVDYQGLSGSGSNVNLFIAVVGSILREENMGYRVDEKGGLHPFVDTEFERSRVAALSGLGLPRYATALQHYEAAHAALDGTAPDTRTAIREAFDAVETVFKLMFVVPRLGAAEIKRSLAPRAKAGLTGAERDSAGRMIESMAEWTNAAHLYRHAEGTEQPASPSMTHAVLMMSAGAGYLRWLIEIDRAEAAAV